MTGVWFVQVKALEDSYSSRVKQLMKEQDGQLQRANKDNANLERQLSKYRKRNANLKHQLSDCREDFERLQSIQNSMQAHFKCPISQVRCPISLFVFLFFPEEMLITITIVVAYIFWPMTDHI